MKVRRLASAALGLIALVAVGSPGCSGDDPNTATSTTTTSSSSTSAASSGGGGAGTGGAGGAGGAGGVPADYGPPSSETVSAGDVTQSAQFKMVFTLGQPTQNQGTLTSPAYRMQGGVIGANGSLP